MSSHSIFIVVSGYFFSFFVRAFCMRVLDFIQDEVGYRSFSCWFRLYFFVEIVAQTNHPKGMYKGNRRKEVCRLFGHQNVCR